MAHRRPALRTWGSHAALLLLATLPLGLAAQAPAPAPAKPAAGKPAAKAPATRPAAAAPGACVAPAQPASTLSLSSFRDCLDTPELVRLPAGKFLMGEPENSGGLGYEQPQHEVRIRAFAMGKYEVTFDEWDACFADGFCQTRPDDAGWGRGSRPVINVTWVDAQQYVAWLSRKTGQRYRLPSEAEWEYAARAGTLGAFPWGDATRDACKYGNSLDISGREAHPNWSWSISCDDSYAATAPVGSFPPNPWGLRDMHGNVWEWVQDCWHSDYRGAPGDGSAWVTGQDCGKRVNRGGGWGNHPRTLRSAKRDADQASSTGNAFGFRVVREIPPPPAVAPVPVTPASATASPAP